MLTYLERIENSLEKSYNASKTFEVVFDRFSQFTETHQNLKTKQLTYKHSFFVQ